MERYKNLSGDSGVVSYEIGADSITVLFNDGWYYLFTHASAGQENIEHMQELALAGQGLNSFINRAVKEGYTKKWR